VQTTALSICQPTSSPPVWFLGSAVISPSGSGAVRHPPRGFSAFRTFKYVYFTNIPINPIPFSLYLPFTIVRSSTIVDDIYYRVYILRAFLLLWFATCQTFY